MKLTLHPLFLVIGLLSAIFGGLPVFIIYALTALLHECGHIFCASRLGFKCERISLMPYGAAATCQTEGISRADEIKLALAGPAVNAFICVATAGLWWFFPVTYAYTDTIFTASAVMLAINLLPAYPLDGGRVARCLLCALLPEKGVKIAMRAISLMLAAALVALFFVALKNLSLLTFASFLVCSAFSREIPLTRINFAAKKSKRGKEVRHVLLNADSTYKDALRYTDGSKYIIFQFYGDGILDEICEDELYEQLQSHGIYDKILQ